MGRPRKIHVPQSHKGGRTAYWCGRTGLSVWNPEEPHENKNLERATCAECLKRLRDLRMWRVVLDSKVVETATERLEQLRRKPRKKARA